MDGDDDKGNKGADNGNDAAARVPLNEVCAGVMGRNDAIAWRSGGVVNGVGADADRGRNGDGGRRMASANDDRA